jgi:Helix-turn-helix domain
MNSAPIGERVKGQTTGSRKLPGDKVSDAIDDEPLTGGARNEFEGSLYAKVKRSHQLLLRILLDFAGGKAECWPGNKRIAEIAGFQPRNVQLIIRALEAAQLIRCVLDRSLKTQRRIVILDHPNAVRVLVRLGDQPWMQLGAQETAPKQPEKVHPGAQKPVHPGAQKPVHPGAQRAPADFPLDSNSETRIPFFSHSFNRPKPRPHDEQLAYLRGRVAGAAPPPERTA